MAEKNYNYEKLLLGYFKESPNYTCYYHYLNDPKQQSNPSILHGGSVKIFQ